MGEEADTITRRVGSRRLSVPAAWSAALVAYCIAIYGGFIEGRAGVWLTDLAWTAAPFLAALASWRAAQAVAGPLRTAWRLLTAACASWLIGQLFWDWNELIRGVSSPFPSVSDFFYIGYSVLVVAAIFAMRGVARGRAPTARHAGNLALIGCSFAGAYVTAILEPTLQADRSLYFAAIALTTSLVVAAAFLVSLHSLWSYRWDGLSGPLILVAAGVGVQAAAEVLYVHALLGEQFGPKSFLNVAWLASFAFQHWAADEQVRLARGVMRRSPCASRTPSAGSRLCCRRSCCFSWSCPCTPFARS